MTDNRKNCLYCNCS